LSIQPGAERSLAVALVVFVVVPGAAVSGDWAIVHPFGNGRYLPINSTGDHVLRWWDD
jgi:hypothetical protein